MLTQTEKLAQIAEKELTNRGVEKLVRTFIHTCLDKGLTVNKGFELIDELMIMIEQKRYDENLWHGLVNKAIAEANNKEGVML
jgi:NADH dehydrogenase FAD-containing subunit